MFGEIVNSGSRCNSKVQSTLSLEILDMATIGEAVNNKGTDQTARICAFDVRIWHEQVFSWRGSIIEEIT